VRRRDQLLERMNSLGIRIEDLEESFSRSGGPGGQHVNKVSSAATIRHRPTGHFVTASDSRSQSENRHLALTRLLDLLEKQEQRARQECLAAASKTRRQNSRRSRRAKAKLVEGKRRRGETKRLRGKVRSIQNHS
jgi:protein subunit release factor B